MKTQKLQFALTSLHNLQNKQQKKTKNQKLFKPVLCIVVY